MKAVRLEIFNLLKVILRFQRAQLFCFVGEVIKDRNEFRWFDTYVPSVEEQVEKGLSKRL